MRLGKRRETSGLKGSFYKGSIGDYIRFRVQGLGYRV